MFDCAYFNAASVCNIKYMCNKLLRCKIFYRNLLYTFSAYLKIIFNLIFFLYLKCTTLMTDHQLTDRLNEDILVDDIDIDWGFLTSGLSKFLFL